jgi:coenzyme F420-reducing hydrogenase gamma subunit
MMKMFLTRRKRSTFYRLIALRSFVGMMQLNGLSNCHKFLQNNYHKVLQNYEQSEYINVNICFKTTDYHEF